MNHERPEWVLALDDDPWALEIVSAMLETHGYQVQRALSMEEAIEVIRRLGNPSLLLIDGMMPNIDGFTACRTFRELPAFEKVPIVFLTALNGERDRVAALEAGADDFLTKPISESMLITRVRTLVELYRRRLHTEVGSRYEAVMDAIGDGILILDRHDQLIEANQAALSLLSIPRNPLRTIHLPTFVEQHWVVERGSIGPASEALLVWGGSGPPTAIEWTSRVLPGRGSGRWAVVVRDATDRWERDQALGRMMRSLGHKLRTPLTGLSVSLDLAKQVDVEEDRLEMIEMAESSAQRLQETIVRILEFTDTATLPAAADASMVAPHEFSAAFEMGVDTSFTNSLNRAVRVDMEAALRAVEELVQNARSVGASEIRIHVAHHPGGAVQIEVSDDGPGLPSTVGRRALEPFFQTDRTGEGQGAGLGLSIVEATVKRAGGSMGIWSSAGERTTVWLRLPDHSEDADARLAYT